MTFYNNNAKRIRNNFPIFKNKKLVYLDNASTSQIPNEVVETIKEYYEKYKANIGRGIYIPAEIKDKNLTVEVGNKIFVKKSIPETKRIIEEQINKLDEARQQIEDKIEELRVEVNQVMKSEDKNRDKKKD